MKHARHSGKRSQSRDLNSYSSRDIVSRTSTTKRALDTVSKILFPIEMLLVIALIVYITLVQFFPLKYILIFIVLLGILAGVHIKLLTGKRRRIKRKRIISIAVSVVMIVVSAFGMSYLGLLNSAIGDITLGTGENEDQVDNISKHPFVVYISGIDTRDVGEIHDKGLSDVNMVVVVNPQKKKVLMVSTPRDYYVGLDGDQNKLDKLTHAGSYGIECSMSTLEALYGVEFNYYAKVNFKSVVDIVDALGGVTVSSDYNFVSRHSLTEKEYSFKKGENFVLGDAALAFVRERKSFPEGDRQRGIHQQILIKSVVEKAISPAMLVPANIEDMLKAISNNTKTNFSEKEIKKLISYQIDTMGSSWEFASFSVNGTGEMNYTYSYPNQKLSVMRPDMETVENAKIAINAVINGEDIPQDILEDNE